MESFSIPVNFTFVLGGYPDIFYQVEEGEKSYLWRFDCKAKTHVNMEVSFKKTAVIQGHFSSDLNFVIFHLCILITRLYLTLLLLTFITVLQKKLWNTSLP